MSPSTEYAQPELSTKTVKIEQYESSGIIPYKLRINKLGSQ